LAERPLSAADLRGDDRVGGGESPAAAINAILRTIARHRLVFGAVILLCLLATALLLSRREPSYEATATILVSAVPAADESLVGVPLIRASELDPQRAAATAAPLLGSPRAARAVAADLDSDDPDAVTAAVTIAAVPNSSLVEVTAEANSADGAAALANAYAGAALRVRDETLTPQVREAIADTKRQLGLLADPAGGEALTLEARLAALGSILHRGDPTLAIARPASAGVSQGTPAKQVLIVALLVGIVLAALTVVMIELLTARPIDTETELIRVYPLPILARAPAGERRPGAELQRPFNEARPGVREGFRILRSQLDLRVAPSVPGRGSTVLLVSAERGDGRAACSLNLARAFCSAGNLAAVVELDVRDPKMATMLGVDPPGDVSALLAGTPAESVAFPLDDSGDLRLLAAPPAVDLVTHEAITTGSAGIVDAARTLADWIVVDAPPVAEAAADVAAVLDEADHIVVVVRLGSTRPEGLGLIRELFEQRGRRPDGYLVLSGVSAGG
jgi:Mrp family chromosome partitioning ATPase/capsular polysaccharide biosynthesis protein